MFGITGKQGLVVLLVIGAVAAAVWIDGRDRVERRVPVSRVKPSAPPVREITVPVPATVDLERLSQRTARRTATGDPFESRGWTAPREKPREVVAEPEPERAPPLPFKYLGRWSERGRVAVVLGRDARHYIAAVDEVLDGTYRVDAIETNRVVLTYLPLGTRQTLAFDAAPVAALTAAPQARMENAEATLRVAIPTQAAVAEEFTILLNIDPRLAASVDRGSVELLYDPKVLNVTVVGTTRMPSSAARPDPGRVQLELGGGHIGHAGPATAVRLRVVAEGATTTQLRLASLSAYDAEERDLAVAVDGPNPRTLTILAAPKK